MQAQTSFRSEPSHHLQHPDALPLCELVREARTAAPSTYHQGSCCLPDPATPSSCGLRSSTPTSARCRSLCSYASASAPAHSVESRASPEHRRSYFLPATRLNLGSSPPLHRSVPTGYRGACLRPDLQPRSAAVVGCLPLLLQHR
jgi:hypothetical protein